MQELLGRRLTSEKVFAPAVPNDLAVRWNEIAQLGLPPPDLLDLITKYPVIDNCRRFVLPQLDPELVEILPDREKLRDQRLFLKQERAAAALTALSQPLVSLIKANRRADFGTIAALSDVARLIADMYHQENNIRRVMAESRLGKLRDKLLKDCPSDEFLFGKNLLEVLKAAKAVSQSVADLRGPKQPPKNAKLPPRRPFPPRQGARGGQKPRYPQANHQPVRPAPTGCPRYRQQAQPPQFKRKRSTSRRR